MIRAVSNSKKQNLKVVNQMSGSTDSISRLFGDLTNYTIGSQTLNINPISTTASSKVDEELNNLVPNTVDEQ